MTGAEIVATGITHITVVLILLAGFIAALIGIFSFREDD